jgi:D-galacturonate reductase
MRILVVGAGMYVTGRGGTGSGTILASLCEASRHLPIDGVTVVARDPANAAVVAETIGALNRRLGTALDVGFLAVPGDAEAALTAAAKASRADTAIISVPDHLHHPYTAGVLDRGMHALVVKPFVPTLAEGRDLVARQRARARIGAVEFHKRWDEQNLLARRLLRQGELGSLLYSVVQYSQRIDIPRDVFKSWAMNTNIFQYLGVHYVDLVYFLTGARPLRVSALGTRGALAGLGIDTPDSVHATVVWAPAGGGPEIVTQFAVNWIDPSCTTALSDQRYSLVGTAGRLDLDQKDRGVTLASPSGGVRTINPYFAEFVDMPGGKERYGGYGPRSIVQFLQDVADVDAGRVALGDLEGNRPTFADALISTAVVEAAGRSLGRDGAWEVVSDARA